MKIIAYTGKEGTDTVGLIKSYPAEAVPQFALWNSETQFVNSFYIIVVPTRYNILLNKKKDESIIQSNKYMILILLTNFKNKKKMKTIKYLSMWLMIVAMSVSFVGCGDDDEPTTDYAGVIAGTYSGDLRRMSDGTTKPGYVILTRVSETTVFLTLLKSESLNIDLQENYELNIIENNGSYKLTTGSNYQISGFVTGKRLELTAVFASGHTFVFSGSK